jgi:hypothetical protein
MADSFFDLPRIYMKLQYQQPKYFENLPIDPYNLKPFLKHYYPDQLNMVVTFSGYLNHNGTPECGKFTFQNGDYFHG